VPKQTKIHPFDYDKLQKGTWIETAELEQATRYHRDDPRFLQGVMGVMGAIEMNTGILSTLRQKRLRLMTDAEAIAWNVRQAAEASRRLERTAERLRDSIDRRNLNSVELRLHDHASRVVNAMADAQRLEREKHARLFAFIGVNTRALKSGD
jgi:hypothetical protein